MRDIRPIRNLDDLSWALDEVEIYFTSEPEIGTAESDRFLVLCDLIEAYESRHVSIEAMEPIELLKGFMELTNRSQADLAALFGSRSRASEVLKRKRRLTVEMINMLSREWRVPADLLVMPYELAA